MIKRIKTIAVASTLAAAATMSAMACSSGGGPPPTASQIVQSDGYTLAKTFSTATINSSMGVAAPYISSAAIGTEGSNMEAVVVFDSGDQGMAQLAQSEISSAGSGVTANVSGNVLRITGPDSALSNLGS